jgi:hypothetical protein
MNEASETRELSSEWIVLRALLEIGELGKTRIRRQYGGLDVENEPFPKGCRSLKQRRVSIHSLYIHPSIDKD